MLHFRILRDRSFVRISDEDWGELVLKLVQNVLSVLKVTSTSLQREQERREGRGCLPFALQA